MAILELRSASQARKTAILQNLYGVSDAATLRAASTKTNDEILSAQGEGLIAALQSVRLPSAGCFHFSTVSPTSKIFTVKTSTGYARLVNPDNTLGTQAGTGTAANNITLTIPAGTGHRSYGVISVTNGGSSASGSITSISMTAADNRITAVALSSLTSCVSITLNNTRLTSFNGGSNLTACTFLDLSSNILTSFNRGGGTSLSACTTINLYDNQLTSFNVGSGLTSCIVLQIYNNRLTSFNAPTMSALNELYLYDNASVLDSFILHPDSFQGLDGLIELNNSNQTEDSLNNILSGLPTTPIGAGSTIRIENNIGSSTCNTALAPSDWNVITSV